MAEDMGLFAFGLILGGFTAYKVGYRAALNQWRPIWEDVAKYYKVRLEQLERR